MLGAQQFVISYTNVAVLSNIQKTIDPIVYYFHENMIFVWGQLRGIL